MSANKKLLALFPGQGSQAVGMGRDLCDRLPLAKDLFAAADAALGFSLSEICFNGPIEKLTQTEVVQPAILTVSTICFRAAGELNIAAAAGHSLGEYSALVAAEALDFTDAVRLVNKRGRYMQEAVPAGQGKMLAVIGKEVAELEEAVAQVNGRLQIANINAPGQIVVSGEAGAVDALAKILEDTRTIELNVSAPFHCELMKPAADRLAQDLDAIEIHPCKFPVYANFHAKPVTRPEEIRQALKDQVCGQVLWVDCIRNAIANEKPEAAMEFGPGGVLAGLLKRITKEIKIEKQ